MILILEGPNKTGKTTLAEFFVQNYGFRYIKNRKWYDIEKAKLNTEKRLYAESAITSISEMLKFFDKNYHYIIDRHHWTEYAYGLTNRGYVSKMFFEVDRFLVDESIRENLDIRVLYLTDKLDTLTMRNGLNMLYLTQCFDLAQAYSELPSFKANAKNIHEITEWLSLPELADFFLYNEYAASFLGYDHKAIVGD